MRWRCAWCWRVCAGKDTNCPQCGRDIETPGGAFPRKEST